jgi:hypothetical protein
MHPTARTLTLAAMPALSAPMAHAQAPAGQGAARNVITSSEPLPRRTIQLDKLPSEYLTGPREQLLPLAAQLEANLRSDLERFDIQHAATRGGYPGLLLSLAPLRRDWAAVPALVERQRAEVERRYGALNWADAGDQIKGSKGQFEWLSPAVTLRSCSRWT